MQVLKRCKACNCLTKVWKTLLIINHRKAQQLKPSAACHIEQCLSEISITYIRNFETLQVFHVQRELDVEVERF